MVELVDETRALAHDRLESTGDLAQQAKFPGQGQRGGGSFTEGEARGGARLDGIGLFAAEQRGAIVLVALGIAAGDRGAPGGVRPRSKQRVQKSEKVVGVLSGGIEADAEVDGGGGLGQPFEALLGL